MGGCVELQTSGAVIAIGSVRTDHASCQARRAIIAVQVECGFADCANICCCAIPAVGFTILTLGSGIVKELPLWTLGIRAGQVVSFDGETIDTGCASSLGAVETSGAASVATTAFQVI